MTTDIQMHVRVRHRLNHEVRRGRLPRVSSVSCIDCGACAQEYDHARGYALDRATDADPVCQPCHNRRKVERGEMSRGLEKAATAARGDRNGSRLHPERVPRGEKNGNSKLTEVLVVQIRTMSRAGVTRASIARELRVSPSIISQVARGVVWKHVIDDGVGHAPIELETT